MRHTSCAEVHNRLFQDGGAIEFSERSWLAVQRHILRIRVVTAYGRRRVAVSGLDIRPEVARFDGHGWRLGQVLD